MWISKEKLGRRDLNPDKQIGDTVARLCTSNTAIRIDSRGHFSVCRLTANGNVNERL